MGRSAEEGLQGWTSLSWQAVKRQQNLMYILQGAVRKTHQSPAFGRLLPGLKFLLIFVSYHANKQTKQKRKKKKKKKKNTKLI